MGMLRHLFIIWGIYQSYRSAKHINALVWHVHSSVAVMIVVDAGTDAPLWHDVVGNMSACTKIDKPSRADEKIVDIVAIVVFLVRIAHAHRQHIVNLPSPRAQQRTVERGISGNDIAQSRNVVNWLVCPPLGVFLTMHPYTMMVAISQSE